MVTLSEQNFQLLASCVLTVRYSSFEKHFLHEEITTKVRQNYVESFSGFSYPY